MDIKEIKKEKYELENTISNLIYEFNKKTNVVISAIDIEIIDVTSFGDYIRPLYKVKTIIKL